MTAGRAPRLKESSLKVRYRTSAPVLGKRLVGKLYDPAAAGEGQPWHKLPHVAPPNNDVSISAATPRPMNSTHWDSNQSRYAPPASLRLRGGQPGLESSAISQAADRQPTTRVAPHARTDEVLDSPKLGYSLGCQPSDLTSAPVSRDVGTRPDGYSAKPKQLPGSRPCVHCFGRQPGGPPSGGAIVQKPVICAEERGNTGKSRACIQYQTAAGCSLATGQMHSTKSRVRESAPPAAQHHGLRGRGFDADAGSDQDIATSPKPSSLGVGEPWDPGGTFRHGLPKYLSLGQQLSDDCRTGVLAVNNSCQQPPSPRECSVCPN